MAFVRNKKNEVHKGDVFLARGIYLKKPEFDNGKILVNCFLRSVIVFLLAFGCIGSFLSALSISYNYVLVIFFYLILSLYFSFLYSTSKLIFRDIGYILFFIVFVWTVLTFRIYANSGLYSMINAILNQAQAFFNLSGIRQYEVLIDNSYQTIAILAIFIGVVLIILLNIWISSSMSVFWSLLLTFPILLIPLYMKLVPDSFYAICLLCGYLAVFIFKSNGHFVTYLWDSSFRIKGLNKNKITYTQDAKTFRQVLAYILLLGFSCIVLAGNFLPVGSFETCFGSDKLRDETSDSIGNFLLLGFSSFYNQYSTTGGLAEGKLGGISNVRPDYQPDLIVNYAPYSTNAIYLKGFTGGFYSDNEWINIYDYLEPVDRISDEISDEMPDEISDEKNDINEIRENSVDDIIGIYTDDCMKQEATMLQFEQMKKMPYSGQGKMTVKNVGANTGYLYLPYYTILEDYTYHYDPRFETLRGIAMQGTAEYEYYPKLVWEDSLLSVTPASMNLENVSSTYLYVPEVNEAVIKAECEKMGLTSEMSVGSIVDTVQTYFRDNIPYTLKPGATPKDEDFVSYFLTKNRKGYCAHFASAATLMFREMGIPARYVEGYAFSFETALASEENEKLKYEDFYKGYSEIGESTVLEVEVTDAMAHAWVEIYIDGFGWKQVEVTPGSNEVVDENDFWSAFTKMLQENDLNTQNRGNNFGNLNLSQYKEFGYIVLVVVLCIVAIRFILILIRKMRRFLRCHQRKRQEALVAYYADLCDMLRLCDENFDSCRSHKEQLQYMKERQILSEEVEPLKRQLEWISYGKDDVLEEILDGLAVKLRKMRKKIWKQASFGKKICLLKR